MNLIQNTTAPKGALLAGLALLGSLIALPSTARAQYLDLGPLGLTLTADAGTSAAYRIDLFDTAAWTGNELRLVSFLGGELWTIDSPLDLRFTGSGSSLVGHGLTGVIDGSLAFTAGGFITPGAWSDGGTHYLGLHREIDGEDYFGAIGLRYNQDNSLSLLQFGIARGSFDLSQFTSLAPIPEPAGAMFSLAALSCAGAILRRRRHSRPATAAA